MPDSEATPPPLLTREQVLRALRQIAREHHPLPPGTVYELVYRGRRYPPRAVAELALRLATDNPRAQWPRPAGAPTNMLLESLDFTISTRRASLTVDPAYHLDPDKMAPPETENRSPDPNFPSHEAAAVANAAEPTAAYSALPYLRAELLAELFIPEAAVDAALAGLTRRHNLLLQGPPGTGKTFLARRLAWLLLGTRDDSRIELLQFHPSYGYEDFMQGFRPAADGHFQLVSGVLPLLCQRAAADPDRPYFLLIDEVNRGNISRIFGEFLLLLESDKRGPAHALRLPYSPPEAPRFFVPANLYVIGTLNLADRSLSPLDYALRRRFAFVSLGPQFGAPLREFLAARQVPEAVIIQLIRRLTALNQTIADDPELGPDFEIGHSYFCQPPPQPDQAAAWLRLIIEQEIGPLLTDYWREQPATAAAQLRKLLA